MFRTQRGSLGFWKGLISGLAFVLVRAYDIDRGSVQPGLDVRRIILFYHLDAGAAVFGDLIDLGTFHFRIAQPLQCFQRVRRGQKSTAERYLSRYVSPQQLNSADVYAAHDEHDVVQRL